MHTVQFTIVMSVFDYFVIACIQLCSAECVHAYSNCRP